MSFFHRRRSSSQSTSPIPENSPLLKNYTSITHPEMSNMNQPDSHHVTLDRQPSSHPQATSAHETARFIYEDINPPAQHSSPTLPQTQTQTPPMLSDTHPQSQAQPHSALPAYDMVSGSVIVDANGYPYFLNPQEERERNERLQRAVHERMMGLPRKTEFTWEATGNPVPPKYEARESLAEKGA
ncbi:hypothetical protein BJX70DRAFT_365278 [Aspergillus crustosus]